MNVSMYSSFEKILLIARKKKAMQAAGRYEVEDLRRILCSAYAIENDIKSGRLSMEMALEMFIAEM